jgi:hypothetical protein
VAVDWEFVAGTETFFVGLGGDRIDSGEGWAFPVGIGLRDPRSQKRDLGHPSVLPFGFSLGFTLRFQHSVSASVSPFSVLFRLAQGLAAFRGSVAVESIRWIGYR